MKGHDEVRDCERTRRHERCPELRQGLQAVETRSWPGRWCGSRQSCCPCRSRQTRVCRPLRPRPRNSLQGCWSRALSCGRSCPAGWRSRRTAAGRNPERTQSPAGIQNCAGRGRSRAQSPGRSPGPGQSPETGRLPARGQSPGRTGSHAPNPAGSHLTPDHRCPLPRPASAPA